VAAPSTPQAETDSESEQTTRQILISAKRVRASAPVADSEPGLPEGSSESDSDGGHSARASGARLAVHSTVAAPTASDPALSVAQDTTRLGPYHVVCELASGGMATVYLAIYRSVEGFEKLCAVKRIHPHLANDRAFTNMFADEAQIAARISHPYVCSVFSFGRTQQSHYIAMEFLRGEPLSAVSRRVARSPELGDDPRFPMFAARLVANFAEGLYAAHTLRDERGAPLDVVHRDVTPQNLFVLYDGSVRVTDFGIAHARRRLHHTQGQKLKGKLSYIAPEQLSEGAVDARVDVWGLGVTLWELLAGRRLFLGSSEGETLAAVMSRVVQPPSAFRATVPIELDRIVLRALDRDVNKRYKSARDLSRDLERFLSSLGDQVPPMDVADWMANVFPQGAERIQALVELAARVSVATADDTIVRVPSAPPPRLPSRPPGSYHMLTVPPASVSSIPPSYPSTRANQPMPKLAAPAAEPTPPSAELPAPSNAPSARAALDSKPRLVLVEEESAERARPALPNRQPSWVLPALAALLLALATGALAAKLVNHSPAVPATPAAPSPQARPLAAPPVAVTLPAVQPIAPEALADEAPVAEEAAPAIRPVKAAPKVRAASSAATPAAAPTLQAVGDVFIATPGGSGDVFEQGRLLGHAPGTFRLSVGRHELTLRTTHGTSHSVSVNVARSAATVVTVDASR